MSTVFILLLTENNKFSFSLFLINSHMVVPCHCHLVGKCTLFHPHTFIFIQLIFLNFSFCFLSTNSRVDPNSGKQFFVDHNTHTTHWQLPVNLTHFPIVYHINIVFPFSSRTPGAHCATTSDGRLSADRLSASISSWRLLIINTFFKLLHVFF